MAQTVILGEKVGMTQKWVDDKVVPVTVLRVEPMRIVQIKTTERDGYTALQVTQGHRDAKKLNKPTAGHYAKAGVQPGVRLVELRVDTVDGFQVGQEITVESLPAGSRVDVTYASGNNKVPDVSGDSEAEARRRLEQEGFTVPSNPQKEESADAAPGTVLRTTPSAGETIRLGSTVTIVVATAPATPTPTDTATPLPTDTASTPPPGG